MRRRINIYVDDVIHLAKEIVARYGLSSTPFGGVRIKTESAKERHAIRSPTGRKLAANLEEFTQICIQRRWITHSENLDGMAMTDAEYCVDWDRIYAEQARAASRRDPSHPAGNSVASSDHQVFFNSHNRRVVLSPRGSKKTRKHGN